MNITEHIDDFEMPLCPICQEPIDEHELVAVVTAHGYKGLACLVCVENLSEQDQDDES